jgi:hypothetical protein
VSDGRWDTGCNPASEPLLRQVPPRHHHLWGQPEVLIRSCPLDPFCPISCAQGRVRNSEISSSARYEPRNNGEVSGNFPGRPASEVVFDMARAQTPSGGPQARTSSARRARPTKAAAKTAARGGARAPAVDSRRKTTATKTTAARRSVTVPLANVRIPVVGLHVPGADKLGQQTRWAAGTVRSFLPPVERILYYGGLGTAAVVGVLEWPVAVAAGAAVWVATRSRGRVNRPASL